MLPGTCMNAIMGLTDLSQIGNTKYRSLGGHAYCVFDGRVYEQTVLKWPRGR